MKIEQIGYCSKSWFLIEPHQFLNFVFFKGENVTVHYDFWLNMSIKALKLF